MASLASTCNVHIAVVGFVRDPEIAPIDSTIAFVNSNLMAEMTGRFRLPVREEVAVGMQNLCDAIYALRYVKN